MKATEIEESDLKSAAHACGLTNGVHMSCREHMNSGVTETWQLYSRPIQVQFVDGRIMDKIIRSRSISII